MESAPGFILSEDTKCGKPKKQLKGCQGPCKGGTGKCNCNTGFWPFQGFKCGCSVSVSHQQSREEKPSKLFLEETSPTPLKIETAALSCQKDTKSPVSQPYAVENPTWPVMEIRL